jgi:hypothetical protein
VPRRLGRRLLCCVDAAGARCVTLLSGSAVGTTANAFLLQTRNYVQLYPVSGTLVTSVRKADGASVQIDIPTGGFVQLWSSFGSAGQAAGDRLFYWHNNGSRNLVGSILADGSDRKEFDGTPISTVWTLPQRLAPHRLGNLDGVAPTIAAVRAGAQPAGNGSVARSACGRCTPTQPVLGQEPGRLHVAHPAAGHRAAEQPHPLIPAPRASAAAALRFIRLPAHRALPTMGAAKA